MRIQYVSDIHLEHNKFFKPDRWLEPDPAADLLVLAGDIGYAAQSIFTTFFAWCSERWPQIVYVPGNHEFYGATGGPEATVARIRAVLAPFKNVHVLNRDHFEPAAGWRILGCTLWSAAAPGAYFKGINDFIRIEGATPETYQEWHERDRDWLAAELASPAVPTDMKTIVVTHHLPTYKLISPAYEDSPLNSFFATDLEDLILRSQPAAWICGHTHQGGAITLGATQLVMNPYGYPGERVPTRRPQVVLEL